LKKSKKILFISVNRSDYGIWRPILKELKGNKNIVPDIFATGSHFSKKFGHSIDEIYHDNFCNKVFEARYDDSGSEPDAASLAMSHILQATGELLSETSYDAIAVLGDRFEMLAAASAIVPFCIPIIHFHGGSITEGAIDDSFRHAITKLSHYHMVETEDFKNRVLQLGEPESKIIVTGAPSLSILKTLKFEEKRTFLSRYNIPSNKPYVLVTLHSETTKKKAYNEVLATTALNTLIDQNFHILITAPNPDPYHEPIIDKINQLEKSHAANITFVKHLGHENYFNAMHHCLFVAGNSSSGIIEAASLSKFSLNIGDRQKNRLCDPSVVHARVNMKDIKNGIDNINQSLASKNSNFKKSIYGDGSAPEIFIDFLTNYDLTFNPKVFEDIK
jgi:UDP-hydrolysing UDP-N-acetyl-D-glucosamine 2-epimerase